MHAQVYKTNAEGVINQKKKNVRKGNLKKKLQKKKRLKRN